MKRNALRSMALLMLVAPLAVHAQATVVDGYGYQSQQQPYSNAAGGAYGAQGGGTAAPYGAAAPYGSAAPAPYGSAAPYGSTAQPGYPQTSQVSGQGEVFLQLQQLQNEVARLRGMLEEQQYELQRIKQENLERYQDVDSRLTSLKQTQQAAPAQTPAAGGAINAAADPVPPAAAAASGDPEKEKLLYDASFDLVKNRDFAKADLAFSAFLRKYPNSQYAGNAQYWLGEVKLAQNDLPASATAFNQVIDKYPQSQKVADAIYKLAEVERRQGNKDRARQLLQQVTSQYPKSSAAQLAQRELSRQ